MTGNQFPKKAKGPDRDCLSDPVDIGDPMLQCELEFAAPADESDNDDPSNATIDPQPDLHSQQQQCQQHKHVWPDVAKGYDPVVTNFGQTPFYQNGCASKKQLTVAVQGGLVPIVEGRSQANLR